jgi:uncharacterized protein YuzE
MMKQSYDPQADAFAIRFAPENVVVVESEEVAPGVILDFDAEGEVVAIEVLGVSRRMKQKAAVAA